MLARTICSYSWGLAQGKVWLWNMNIKTLCLRVFLRFYCYSLVFDLFINCFEFLISFSYHDLTVLCIWWREVALSHRDVTRGGGTLRWTPWLAKEKKKFTCKKKSTYIIIFKLSYLDHPKKKLLDTLIWESQNFGYNKNSIDPTNIIFNPLKKISNKNKWTKMDDNYGILTSSQALHACMLRGFFFWFNVKIFIYIYAFVQPCLSFANHLYN